MPNMPAEHVSPVVKRLRLTGLVFLLAPLTAPALDGESTAHLLRRTGFGPGPGDMAGFEPLDRTAAVRRLLDGIHHEARTPPPAWTGEPLPDPRARRTLSDEQRKQLRAQFLERARELKGWWLREMLDTDSPLTEHLTLFWHNHFTSSLRKVKSPTLLYRQNTLLRRHAAGNFREMLHAVARDPAMILYLDTHTSRKGKPNENFARELLELFTLGIGHYREQDIKEAARAFTGWTIEPVTGRFRFVAARHDDGDKLFMGRRGRFNGDDILNILLEQPATAEFIVGKLWREFVSPAPDPGEVRRLAELFRAHGYELRPLLEDLFLSNAFWSPANRGVLVKSPVELIAGTTRALALPVENASRLALACRLLGQDLFDPPNVKGWPGGISWINSNTLLARNRIVERLARADEMATRETMARKPDTGLRNSEAPHSGPWLLALPPTTPPPSDDTAREQRRWQLLDPVYQLK
jgi:uncharacterized protein (DUF1800 family)